MRLYSHIKWYETLRLYNANLSPSTSLHFLFNSLLFRRCTSLVPRPLPNSPSLAVPLIHTANDGKLGDGLGTGLIMYFVSQEARLAVYASYISLSENAAYQV